MPSPSSALRYSTARSAAAGKNAAARLSRAGTASPNPIPRQVVATSRIRYGNTPSPMANWLMTSSVIAARSPTRPARNTRLTPTLRVSRAPASAAEIAATACGRNSDP